MKIPPHTMVDIVGEQRVKDNIEMGKYIRQYNLFMQAKNLGVKFTPKDLTSEQLEIFSIIKNTIEKNDEKINRKPTKGKK